MNFRGRSADSTPLTFHVTPFVDILLVLIAFFVLTWSLRQAESDINISLPKAEHGEPERTNATQVIVNIRADGEVVINQRVLDEEDFKSLLATLVEQNPNQLVVIRADQDTDYDDVLRVLDLARGQNVANIGFAALPEENSR